MRAGGEGEAPGAHGGGVDGARQEADVVEVVLPVLAAAPPHPAGAHLDEVAPVAVARVDHLQEGGVHLLVRILNIAHKKVPFKNLIKNSFKMNEMCNRAWNDNAIVSGATRTCVIRPVVAEMMASSSLSSSPASSSR